MECRGEKKRIFIVQNYIVKPICNLKLLNGQIKKSDAGNDITDHYYIFECTLRKNKTKKETIICGVEVAKHFAYLTKQNLPKLFNILKSNNIVSENVKIQKSDNDSFAYNEASLQLYDAIMIIMSIWNIKPQSPIFYVLESIKQNMFEEPKLSNIKSINTMLKNGKTTLRQMLNKLSEKNNIKDYKFDLLIKELKLLKIEQYFED